MNFPHSHTHTLTHKIVMHTHTHTCGAVKNTSRCAANTATTQLHPRAKEEGRVRQQFCRPIAHHQHGIRHGNRGELVCSPLNDTIAEQRYTTPPHTIKTLIAQTERITSKSCDRPACASCLHFPAHATLSLSHNALLFKRDSADKPYQRWPCTRTFGVEC